MTQAGAIKRAQGLKAVLEEFGVKTSIELVVGRPGGPNGGWWTDTHIASMGHHIVSTRTQGLTPGLALVKNGRKDLPGPLCNGYGGFDEIARLICMGWANHSGEGGPFPTPGGTIPKDGGRPYFFGWEFEGGIKESDWPASMHDFMATCLAATLKWLSYDEKSHAEHKTWAPTRKVDRLGYTIQEARGLISGVLNDSEEKDMVPITPGSHPEMIQYLQDLLNQGFGAGLKLDGRYEQPTKDAVIKNLLSFTGADESAPGGAVAKGEYVNSRMFQGLQKTWFAKVGGGGGGLTVAQGDGRYALKSHPHSASTVVN